MLNTQWVLVGCLFSIYSGGYVHLKLLIYPSPTFLLLVTIGLFPRSVSPFLLCKYVHLYLFGNFLESIGQLFTKPGRLPVSIFSDLGLI